MVAPKNTDENATGVGIVDGKKVNILRLLEYDLLVFFRGVVHVNILIFIKQS